MYNIFKFFKPGRLIIFLVLLNIVVPAVNNFACNVPVFRYALERWPADFYELRVYYDQSFDEGSQQLVNQLLTTAGRDSLINLKVSTEDMSGSAAGPFPQLPWIELFYPGTSGINGALWSGPFTAENVQYILTSPARSTLAERLTGGEAAVFLLLESGDQEKDHAAGALLAETLEKMSSELKIPETGYDVDGNEIHVDDFKGYDVRFSKISLSRQDPREEVLVSMLLGSEEDLVYYNDPIAFPVFGRGRSLYGLIGAGLNLKTISHACRSIIGWCSCEVKALNPGVDLLVKNDWSKPAGGKLVKSEPLPPLTGVSAFMEQKSQNEKPVMEKQDRIKISDHSLKQDSVKITEVDYDSTENIVNDLSGQKATTPLMRNILLVFGLGFIFMAGVTYILLQKKRKQ